MSNQWHNCMVQRKSDNKKLEALHENGRCEDITGAYLDPENYRVVELEEDYIDDGKLVPIVDEGDLYVDLFIAMLVTLGVVSMIVHFS